MYHLFCQINIYSYIDFYLCSIRYILYLYLCLFLAQKYLYKNMYILNRFETNCGKSMIPFHAIWGLCWNNFLFVKIKTMDFHFLSICFLKYYNLIKSWVAHVEVPTSVMSFGDRRWRPMRKCHSCTGDLSGIWISLILGCDRIFQDMMIVMMTMTMMMTVWRWR